MINKKLIEEISRKTIRETLRASGVGVSPPTNKPKMIVEQNQVLVPRSFINRSEAQSQRTKEAHESLYHGYVDTFNKVSSEIAAAPKEQSNSRHSAFRNCKVAQTYNFNGLKLHELYFSNVGDATSTIAFNSLPYMRLQRDFGTFENWQFDFIACAMAAQNGWAVTVFEPYTETYSNVVIDGHDCGIPLGAVPVIVMDMWEHAYYRDYVNDKRVYLNATMKELNWSVIEARMVIAERCALKDLWNVQSSSSSNQERIMVHDINHGSAPIDQRQIEGQPAVLPAPDQVVPFHGRKV